MLSLFPDTFQKLILLPSIETMIKRVYLRDVTKKYQDMT